MAAVPHGAVAIFFSLIKVSQLSNSAFLPEPGILSFHSQAQPSIEKNRTKDLRCLEQGVFG